MARIDRYNKKSRSEEKSLSEIIEIFNNNCSDWDLNGNQLYRGLKDDTLDYFIIDPKDYYRYSSVNIGIYQSLLDTMDSWKKSPVRSKSVIMSNSYNDAENYGDVYVIIPFNSPNISMCSNFDLWNSFTYMSKYMENITNEEDWTIDELEEDLFKDLRFVIDMDKVKRFKSIKLDIKDIMDRYEQKYIRDNIKNDSPIYNESKFIKSYVDKLRKGKIDKSLYDFTSDILDFDKNEFKNINSQEDIRFNDMRKSSDRELWTDSKCIGIKQELFEEFKKLVG